MTLSGQTMGTTWSLKAVGVNAATRELIQKHLDQREAVLSHWQKDSALSRFSASESTDWQPMPVELVQVVELARRISEQTEGALDITLAPMIEAAGFAPKLAPQSEVITGWQHLQTRLDPPALKKKVPQMRINVGSVTEGFVIDELILKLRQQGWSDFLLEVGGEVAAMGLAPDGQPWQVGIQAPEAAPGETMETLPLSDVCVSTSGIYRHRQGSQTHLIDPKTGQPISSSLISVSVFHASCALADGYATALMILGPEQGRSVAERLSLRVIWILAESP